MGEPGRGQVGILAQVDQGTAELVPDPRRSAGWTVLVDNVAQSYVDLDDPTHLEFEYARQVAAVIDAAAPAGAPLRVLHLGGGGLTLARYVAATRPGSDQQVVERDGELLALVRRVLPAPAELRYTVGDARDVVSGSPDDAFDLVIGDVFYAARMPRSVASTEFATAVARVLRPGGRYLVNVVDLAGYTFARAHAATLDSVFAEVCVVAAPGPLGGRRFGNVVLAAAVRAGGLPVPALVATAAEAGWAAGPLFGTGLVEFMAGAQPLTDAVVAAVPPPRVVGAGVRPTTAGG